MRHGGVAGPAAAGADETLRYFLDTEFNGFGGELLSLALVPDEGDREFYVVLPLPDTLDPWVERHVAALSPLRPRRARPVG